MSQECKAHIREGTVPRSNASCDYEQRTDLGKLGLRSFALYKVLACFGQVTSTNASLWTWSPLTNGG